MTSGGKSNERKSYNHTTVFVCACVSDYRHAIFQFSHHVLSIENSCTSYIPTDVLKISETDVWDRLANHPFQSCSHTHVPLRSGCLMSGKSNRPTAGYPNPTTTPDCLCAVLNDAPLRCAGDPYPLANAHHSRCAGICIRPVSVPDALVSSNVWYCKACGMSVLLRFVLRLFYAAYCLLLTMVYQM